MAAVDTGKSFANGEQLTAAKLNQMFGNSTFAAGAVDNSTMTINSLGQLAVNQVTSSNVANNGLNLDDIQQIDTDRVLGRLSAGSGNIEQITVDEDLTSVSANHDQLATSKAIKDYIDSQIAGNCIGVGQTWKAVSRAFNTTYTNSTGKPIVVAGIFTSNGADSAFVNINFTHADSSTATVRFCESSNSGGAVGMAGNIIIPVGASYDFAYFFFNSASLNTFQFYELS